LAARSKWGENAFQFFKASGALNFQALMAACLPEETNTDCHAL